MPIRPCDKCTIIAMEAGLEYESGINANIDTGMWLHQYDISLLLQPSLMYCL
jgi:hypothetical protein